MPKILPLDFFNRPTVTVAQDLLGKYLVRSTLSDQKIALQINEVEAYDGPEDLACHASKGKTPRTAVMFGPAGYFYVYFVYGVHWMLNIVTGPTDYPAAILIRGAGHLKGPAKLTKELNINKSLYAQPAEQSTGLWFENRNIQIKKTCIIATPRIGVDYAGPIWSKAKYRFVLK